jgi:hypothetical protein
MYLDRRAGQAGRVEDALRVKKVPTLAIGASIGFIVGITSVGSGTLVIVLLLFLYPRLRGSQMVGTDLAQAIPMVGAAAIAHVLFGDFKLGLTASILIGSLPGVLIGATISSYAPTLFIRGALSAVLLVSGLKLLNVPTLAVGIVLLLSLITLAAAWLRVRMSGRTLREIAGEPVNAPASVGLARNAEDAADVEQVRLLNVTTVGS